MTMMIRAFLVISILISIVHFESSTTIRSITSSSVDIASIHHDHDHDHHAMMNQASHEDHDHDHQYNSVVHESDAVKRCEPSYGFFPCTDDMLGNVFLIMVYEYLISLADKYITTGSELFFRMFGTGVFGASFFSILANIPRAILVFVSGISGTKENIQSSAKMGMGLVAGSIMMSLTLIWGSVVIFGSHDISDEDEDEDEDQEERETKLFDFIEYGVTTDSDTKYIARIMLLTLIPFLILETSHFVDSRRASHIIIIFTFLLTLVYLIAYSTYQVFQPWIQNKRLEFLMFKYVKQHLLQKLLTSNGKPNNAKIKVLFKRADKNRDSSLSPDELEAFIRGINIHEVGLDESDFATKIMEEFDVSGDGRICEKEFVNGLRRWLKRISNEFGNENTQAEERIKCRGPLTHAETGHEDEQGLIEEGIKSTKAASKFDAIWNYCKAVFLISFGTALAVLLGSPLMQSIGAFAEKALVPPFLVSYSVVPFALNYRHAISAIKTSLQKTEKALSTTFCEIYDGVFLNNIMGLTVFLMLVLLRDLTWDVSAEVLVVFIVSTTIGVLASLSTRIPLFSGVLAYLLYPTSQILLFVLTHYVGWK